MAIPAIIPTPGGGALRVPDTADSNAGIRDRRLEMDATE